MAATTEITKNTSSLVRSIPGLLAIVGGLILGFGIYVFAIGDASGNPSLAPAYIKAGGIMMLFGLHAFAVRSPRH